MAKCTEIRELVVVYCVPDHYNTASLTFFESRGRDEATDRETTRDGETRPIKMRGGCEAGVENQLTSSQVNGSPKTCSNLHGKTLVIQKNDGYFAGSVNLHQGWGLRPAFKVPCIMNDETYFFIEQEEMQAPS